MEEPFLTPEQTREAIDCFVETDSGLAMVERYAYELSGLYGDEQACEEFMLWLLSSVSRDVIRHPEITTEIAKEAALRFAHHVGTRARELDPPGGHA